MNRRLLHLDDAAFEAYSAGKRIARRDQAIGEARIQRALGNATLVSLLVRNARQWNHAALVSIRCLPTRVQPS